MVYGMRIKGIAEWNSIAWKAEHTTYTTYKFEMEMAFYRDNIIKIKPITPSTSDMWKENLI